MRILGGIGIDLITRTTKWAAGFKRARRHQSKFERGLKRGAALVAQYAAAYLAVSRITAAFNEQRAAIDGLAKSADRLAISTEAMAGFNLAAKLAGSSTEDVSRALTYMSRTIGEAATGSKEYEDALKRVGVSSAELLRLKPEQQYQRIADGINRLGTQAEKTSAAMDIFGRSGAKMMNLIAGGSGAIENAIRKTKEYGTAISRDAAASIERMNDSLTLLNERWAGIKTTILFGIVPVMEKLVELTNYWLELLDRPWIWDAAAENFSRASRRIEKNMRTHQDALDQMTFARIEARNQRVVAEQEAMEREIARLEDRELERKVLAFEREVALRYAKYERESELERQAHEERMRLGRQRREQEARDRQQSWQFLASMTGQLAGQSKAWFRINKMVAIANAAMNTNEAMTKALAFGPVAGPIMAGVIGAAGLANIAAIRATTFEGGGSVAGAAGGTEAPAPAETAPQPAHTLNLTLQSRGGMVSEEQLLATLEGLNKLLDDGFQLNTRNV
jgi:hypothetical protein